MKKYFFAILFLGLGWSVNAQKTSAAYIFEDYIFENYNGVKKLNEEIQKKQENFQTEFNKLALEYQTANAEYRNSMANLGSETSESLNEKLKKVQGIKEAADNYQRESEKELQEFIGENITRVKSEIKIATAKVAKTKSITYIFTRNKGDKPMSLGRVVLFADPAKTLDISDEVLKILNATVK